MGYSQLKQAIRDAIKQNGSNEITGDLLQTTLLAIVNALNEGSIFGGVATQILNPVGQDPRKFYIAEKPGEYPLFNGLIVPAGKIGIFQTDMNTNEWRLETVDVPSPTVIDNLDSDSSTASLSARMGKFLNAKIEAGGDKNLNKKMLGTLVTGESPWPGFVVSDFIDIPIENFASKVYIWGGIPAVIPRAYDGTNFIELSRSMLNIYDFTICLLEGFPSNAQFIRVPLYNMSEEAKEALFVASDIDADYLSWPFMSLRRLPPVTSAFYGGENQEIKTILDAYPRFKDITGYPSVKVSDKNLFAEKDIVFSEASTASPRYPVYRTGYMPVIPGETYTFSIEGTSAFGYEIRYYDSSYNQISVTNYGTSVAPAGAAYATAKLSSYNNLSLMETDCKIMFEKSPYRTAYEPYFLYVSPSEMPLRDKTFATLGDSFTAGGMWGNKMAEILLAKYIDNQAVSGARWSSDAEGQADALIASGKIPDYILIFLGVNDANNAVVLGDIVYSANLADLPTGTFTGGVQRTLNKLMNAFPGKIIKIGWTPAGAAYTGSLDVSQYIERLKDLSIMYGVQYVETRCCDISRWIAADIDGVYYASDFHPTAAGQEVIGKAMARILICNQ